MSEEI